MPPSHMPPGHMGGGAGPHMGGPGGMHMGLGGPHMGLPPMAMPGGAGMGMAGPMGMGMGMPMVPPVAPPPKPVRAPSDDDLLLRIRKLAEYVVRWCVVCCVGEARRIRGCGAVRVQRLARSWCAGLGGGGAC